MATSLEILNLTDEDAVELGRAAAATEAGAIAIGAAVGSPTEGEVLTGAFATAANAYAIGAGSKATAAGAVQIGAGTNATANSLQFQATQMATVASVNAMINHLTAGVVQQGGLAISATPEEFKTVAATIVNIDGIQVTKAIDTDMPFSAAHVVTALKYGAILVQVGKDGAVTTKVIGTPQAYDTPALAIAALPAADADNVAIGYIVINADAGDWTATTDDLTDGSDLTTAVFVDADLTLPTVV